jgi:endonuclease/exonuclease/phosphatase family metal-dependent hydrolase
MIGTVAVCLTSISLLVACDRALPNDVIRSEPGDTITVMTYNIFHDSGDPGRGIEPWSERRGAVVETLRTLTPDVVGLQEAKVWQVAWLLDQMPEYAAVARGPYADAGLVDAETVAVLFLSDRFVLHESGHFWYSESPDAPGSYGSAAFGGAASPRMATWVRLAARETPQEKGFYVFNTHFISSARAEDPGLARFKSAELLVERIADRAHRDAPFLVTGDLNTGPGSWPLRYLIGGRCESGEPCPEPDAEPRMIDVWESQHPGDTESGTRCDAVTGAEGQRVDHVLVWDPPVRASGRPVILSADIVVRDDGCPSDHRPVVARVVLPVAGGH